MLLHVLRPTSVLVFCEGPGDCSCVPHFFPAGSTFRAVALDGNTFFVRQLGCFELPPGSFVRLGNRRPSPEVFVSVWTASPSVAAVVHRLRALGFRRWGAARVRRYADWLSAQGVRLRPLFWWPVGTSAN
jgi:hypothetical protein